MSTATLARPKPAASQHFANRALAAISWIGLAVSLLTLLFNAPYLLHEGGGAGVVFGNIAQYGWSIAVLLLVFVKTRTIGLRALTGAALAGFFGVASLAVIIGKPFVERFGAVNGFVPLFFAPISEEILKLIPVALFLLLAARNARWRPSVGDAVLFGFTIGSGFALYENILYGRGTFGGWFTTMPFSLLIPSISTRSPMLAGGHAVYAGLTALGLAVTVIYWRKWRFARFALPVTLAIAIVEHITVNQAGSMGFFSGEPPLWSQLFAWITLHGYLSSMLLVAGVAYFAYLETRIVLRGGETLPAALRLRDVMTSLTGSPRWPSLVQLSRRLRYESLRRSAILAVAQTNGIAPDSQTKEAVQRLYENAGLTMEVSE